MLWLGARKHGWEADVNGRGWKSWYCGEGKSAQHESLIAYMMRETFQGLAYLHSFSRIHRDIKSDNILVGAGGTVKIADFGFCVQLTKENQSRSSVLGTPYWVMRRRRGRAMEGWGTEEERRKKKEESSGRVGERGGKGKDQGLKGNGMRRNGESRERGRRGGVGQRIGTGTRTVDADARRWRLRSSERSLTLPRCSTIIQTFILSLLLFL